MNVMKVFPSHSYPCCFMKQVYHWWLWLWKSMQRGVFESFVSSRPALWMVELYTGSRPFPVGRHRGNQDSTLQCKMHDKSLEHNSRGDVVNNCIAVFVEDVALNCRYEEHELLQTLSAVFSDSIYEKNSHPIICVGRKNGADLHFYVETGFTTKISGPSCSMTLCVFWITYAVSMKALTRTQTSVFQLTRWQASRPRLVR